MVVAEESNWIEPEPVDISADLLEISKDSKPFAEILVRRGFNTRDAALPFLYPDHYQVSNPFDFPMMENAVIKVAEAISTKKTIGIWGDFDADGQTATALLVEALSKLDVQIFYQIPVRSQNSHGINIEGLDAFIDNKVELMITCDTGVGENEEIEYATRNGIETIITDHHQLAEKPPDAFAIINPHYLPPNHPMEAMSGVGVAYKFIEAVYHHLGRPKECLQGFLDLVAIGTIADLVPLKGENRYLVQTGIKYLRETKRPGLIELFQKNDIRQSFINEETISFSIAPRLNAMGRLGNANKNIELLTTPSTEIAHKIITELEHLNNERKALYELTKAAAIKMVEESGELAKKPYIFLTSTEWETSVTGVVASALTDRYGRPTFIISAQAGKQARGSARSVEGIDISQVLLENKHLLSRYGGHAMAFGFALDPDKIITLQKSVGTILSKLLEKGLSKEPISIDAYVPLQKACREEFLEQLELLRPFGQSNPKVNLIDKDIRLIDVFHFGKTESHRRLTVETKANTQHNVIWWNSVNEPFPPDRFHMLYTSKLSYYKGRKEPQIELIDYKECALNDFHNLKLSPSIAIVDLRKTKNPVEKISHILQNSSAKVYGEGFYDKPPNFPVFNRFQIEACEVLVISTIPPDYTTFHDLIQTANPKKLILMKPINERKSKPAFISFLTNRILEAIKNNRGMISIDDLASATGHRRTTIRKTLDFLVGRTTLSYVVKDLNQIQIGNFGKPDSRKQSMMLEMDDLLEETAAFRRFYMRSDMQNVINTIDLES